MTLQELKEEAKKEFENFDNSLLSNGTIANIEICLNKTQSEALKNFIDSLITKAYEEGKREERKSIIKDIGLNHKGTFTDEGDNDCWYIDDLIKHLTKTI